MLWHGLACCGTVSRPCHFGRPQVSFSVRSRRPSVGACGTVSRPCHNTQDRATTVRGSAALSIPLKLRRRRDLDLDAKHVQPGIDPAGHFRRARIEPVQPSRIEPPYLYAAKLRRAKETVGHERPAELL